MFKLVSIINLGIWNVHYRIKKIIIVGGQINKGLELKSLFGAFSF